MTRVGMPAPRVVRTIASTSPITKAAASTRRTSSSACHRIRDLPSFRPHGIDRRDLARAAALNEPTGTPRHTATAAVATDQRP